MEKPIKVVPSSTGGQIKYFKWGLKHEAGTRSPDPDPKKSTE